MSYTLAQKLEKKVENLVLRTNRADNRVVSYKYEKGTKSKLAWHEHSSHVGASVAPEGSQVLFYDTCTQKNRIANEEQALIILQTICDEEKLLMESMDTQDMVTPKDSDVKPVTVTGRATVTGARKTSSNIFVPPANKKNRIAQIKEHLDVERMKRERQLSEAERLRKRIANQLSKFEVEMNREFDDICAVIEASNERCNKLTRELQMISG
jgi:hypothetical protein